MLFEIINISYMYCAVFVIWEGFHIVEYDPIHDEDGKACYKFPGNGRCIKKQVKKKNQYYLVGLKPYKKCGK